MVRQRLWQQPGILLTLLICLLIPLGLQAQEPPAEVTPETTAAAFPDEPIAEPEITVTPEPPSPEPDVPALAVLTDTPAPTIEEPVITPEVTVGEPSEPSLPGPATQTPAVPFPPLALVYSTTFDNGDLTGWDTSPGWLLAPSENGLALQTTTGGSAWLKAVQAASMAFGLRFQVQGGALRIDLRQSAAGSYALVIDAAGALTLLRAELPVQNATTGELAGTWHTLRFAIIDDVARATLDGKDILYWQDPQPLPAGVIALSASVAEGGGSLVLDDPAIWQPAGEVVATQPAAVPDLPPIETPLSAAPPGELPEQTFEPSPVESPEPQEGPLPQETAMSLLVTDTFDSGKLYLWIPGQGWNLAPSGDGLALAATGESTATTFAHNTLFNAAAEARFLIPSGTTRLSIRVSEAGQYTIAVSADGHCALYRGETLLQTAELASAETDQWRLLRLSAVEDIVRVILDGVEVMALRDEAPLPPGTITLESVGNGDVPLMVDDFALFIPVTEASTVMRAESRETETPEQAPRAENSVISAAAIREVACSVEALVNAIGIANSTPGSDELSLPAGCTYTLVRPNNSEEGANGLPVITSEIWIRGHGATIERSTASGVPYFRIFRVAETGSLILDDLVIRNGMAATSTVENGGGILNRGNLAVLNSDLIGNQAMFLDDLKGEGGAIANYQGTVIIENSVITGGYAFAGGGIFNEVYQYREALVIRNSTLSNNGSGTGGAIFTYGESIVTIENTTLTANRGSLGGAILIDTVGRGTVNIYKSVLDSNGQDASGNRGGAIYNTGGQMFIENTTFGGNHTKVSGGAIHNHRGTITIRSSTFVSNSAEHGGGIFNSGISDYLGQVDMRNTILAGSVNGDCINNYTEFIPGVPWGRTYYGEFIGFNNLGTDDCADIALGEMSGLDMTLRDNGGPTRTYALLTGSNALDRGLLCPATDQRGIPRPQGSGCDIGAFEREGTAPGTPVLSAPAHREMIDGNRPTLRWGNLPLASRYRLQLSDVEDFSHLLADVFINAPSAGYTITDPLQQGTYYWRVQAHNSVGASNWSEQRGFELYYRPALISPPNGVMTSRQDFGLLWSAFATEYELQVARDPDFRDLFYTNVSTATHFYIRHINPGHYYWRVRSHTWLGNGTDWSEVFDFVVTAPDAPPLSDWQETIELSHMFNALSGGASGAGNPVNGTPVTYCGQATQPIAVASLPPGVYVARVIPGVEAGTINSGCGTGQEGEFLNRYYHLVRANNVPAIYGGTGFDGGTANPSDPQSVWFNWARIWVGTDPNTGTRYDLDGLGDTVGFRVEAGQQLWLYILDDIVYDNLGGTTIALSRVTPHITVSKRVTSIAPDGSAFFEIMGINDGSEPLSGVTLTDPLVPDCNWQTSSTVEPGVTFVQRYCFVRSVRDFTNTITARAVTTSGLELEAQASAFVDIRTDVGTGTANSCTEVALDVALAIGGPITFNCGGGQVTIPVTAPKVISKSTAIDGAGLITLAGSLLQGNSVFHVNSGVVFALDNIAVNGGGVSSPAGGALYNEGTTTLRNCSLSNHLATDGGAIYNTGNLTIDSCTIDHNSASSRGAGIFNAAGGSLTLSRSTFWFNRAIGFGGGIYNAGTEQITTSAFNTNLATMLEGAYGGAIYHVAGATTIGNSTFWGNQARSAGGGVYGREGTVTIADSTFGGNYALFGGGLYRYSGTLRVTNTILAYSNGGNCYGQVTSAGYNLVSDASCAFTARGDRDGIDPLLGGLVSNGGPTSTLILLPRSPAVDAGLCSGPTDQRGLPRPLDVSSVPNRAGGNGCDTGAVEVQNLRTLTVQISRRTDDVNEIIRPDGSWNFDPGQRTIWIGNDAPVFQSFTGLRFGGVTLPRGTPIQLAYLELYFPISAWIPVDVSIAAENADSALTFAQLNRPSQRLLTGNRATHSSNRRWNGAAWNMFGEFSLVVQEVVDRTGWQSGNSLALILRGTGSAWGRFFVTSYDGTARQAPRLVITYAEGQP